MMELEKNAVQKLLVAKWLHDNMKTYIPDPPRLFLISEFSGGVHFSS